MKRVVLNKCHGGFGLSATAVCWLRDHGHQQAIEYPIQQGERWPSGELVQKHHLMGSYLYGIDRSDPLLLQCIDEIGAEAASGTLSELEVVEVYDESWELRDWGGSEYIKYPEDEEDDSVE